MGLSTVAASAALSLFLENANYANIGDATGLRGSTTAGVFYISLHTASPGVGGTQSTSEVSYTGYARVSVVRSTSGWTVTSGSASNDGTITFGTCTAGSAAATHFAVGTDSTGTGNLFGFGALTSTVNISTGNPVASFAATALVLTAA